MGEKRSEAVRAPALSASTARALPSASVMRPFFQSVGNQAMGRLLRSSSGTVKNHRSVAPAANSQQRPKRIAADTSATSSPVATEVAREEVPFDLPIQCKCAECENEAKSKLGDLLPQRKCASCEEEEEKLHLQRKPTGGNPAKVQPTVNEALRSPGDQLDTGTRQFMEARFGHDFSRIQVHLGTAADKSARSLHAHAYTVGEHVVFAAGRYMPGTEAGRSLIAHELTHTVQQQNGFRAETGSAADQAEQEALTNERLIHSGKPLSFSAQPSRLARRDDDNQPTVTVANKPGACSLEQHQKIEPAVRLAIQWLDRSIDRISRFVSNPGDKANQATGEALQSQFRSKDPAIARRVLERLVMIRHDIDSAREGKEFEDIAREDPKVEDAALREGREFKTVCHTNDDQQCQSGNAYVSADRSTFTFCPIFFTWPLESRAESIVHEMAHTILQDIKDRGYRSDRILARPILSTTEALTNADSFGLLVQELGTGRVPTSNAAEDSFAKSCKEITPLLQVAIARGQRWNRAGEQRIFQANSGMLQQLLGADTPQTRQAAYDFYHRAQDTLGQAFDFKCDSECGGKLAKGETAADHTVRDMGIGTAIGGAVGAVIGLLAGSVLGGLAAGAAIGFFAGLIVGAITAHGPRIHVCPAWKAEPQEYRRIEALLAAAYEALGNSAADSLKYARLAGVLSSQFFRVPNLKEIDRDMLGARLARVQAELTVLRAQYQKSSDEFAGSVLGEHEKESVQKGRRDLERQARSEAAASRALWGGVVAAASIRRAVTVASSGNTDVLRARLQISYLALSESDGRARAAKDIPRIEETIRSVWQVNITQGDYAGVTFRLIPSVTYLPKDTPRATNAFLIQVRGPDKDPSAGFSVDGTISLAEAHLQGNRVIVVAHELAHVFGFLDTYITQEKTKKSKEKMSVGRPDPANRPDLLGLIDPVVLERKRREGAITAQDVARQTGQVRLWEGEASIVLSTLGVTPPERQRPTPDSENFDPDVELRRLQRSRQAELDRIQARRQKIDDTVQSVDLAEQIIKLEDEERSLTSQLATP